MKVSLARDQLIPTWVSLEASQWHCILMPKRAPVEEWTSNLSIPVATLLPTEPLSFDIKKTRGFVFEQSLLANKLRVKLEWSRCFLRHCFGNCMEFFIASRSTLFVVCCCKIEQFSVLKSSYLWFLWGVSTQLASNECLQEIQKKKKKKKELY